MAEVLLDSNVVARYLDPDHPAQSEISRAIGILIENDHAPCFVPQVVYELHNFMTRPIDANGLGLSVVETSKQLDQLERTFTLRCPDARTEYALFRDLARELEPTGKKVHDLRLVAAARVLGVRKLLTFNAKDFRRAVDAGHIKVLTPADVIKNSV